MKVEAVKAKEVKTKYMKAKVIKIIFTAFASFVFSRGSVVGVLNPFAVAFTAGQPFNLAIITYIGSVLGFLTMGINTERILSVLMLTVLMAIKFIFKSVKFSDTKAFTCASAFFASLVVNIGGFMILDFGVTDMVIRICETVLTGGLTYFVKVCAETDYFAKKPFNRLQMSSLVILLMIFSLSLFNISFSGFNIGIIFSLILVLTAGFHYNITGGAISGILFAVTILSYDTSYIYLSMVIIIASLISSIFSPLGKIVQAGTFLSVSVFSILIVGVDINMLFNFLSLAAGAGLYLVIPRSVTKAFEPSIPNKNNDTDIKMNVEQRLSFASETIKDLQASLQKVSGRMNDITEKPLTSLYNSTVNNLCKNCGMRIFCWDDNYNSTADSFYKMVDIMKKNGSVTKDDLAEDKKFSCAKEDELLKRLNKSYGEYKANQANKRRLHQIQSLAIEQLSGVSQMLMEVSEEISLMKENDDESAQKVRELFDYLEISVTGVFCTKNQFDRMEIDIYLSSQTELDLEEIQAELSLSLQRSFALPIISQVNSKIRMSVFEKANYTLSFGVCQSAYSDKGTSGDSYEYFIDNKGNAFLVLSDGMGTGKRAALDSKMTCSIILKLIKAGFGLSSIIKFVNSSLQIKSSDESLSTIDLSKLDLYTGQIDFYKAGSAVSYLIMGDNFVRVNTDSLPVGILQGIDFDKHSFILKDSDMVVMLSDGLCCVDEQLLKRAIISFKNLPPQIIAQNLCEIAKRFSKEEDKDDITVAILKVKESKI